MNGEIKCTIDRILADRCAQSLRHTASNPARAGTDLNSQAATIEYAALTIALAFLVLLGHIMLKSADKALFACYALVFLPMGYFCITRKPKF